MDDKNINSLDDSEIIHFKTIPELRNYVRQEYAARLTKLYNSGSPDQPRQQQLFNAVDKAKLGAEYFYKFINEEAAKRGVEPVKLIEYFSSHKKELLSLFEEPKVKIELKVKKPLPKFSKIYAHAEIENIMQAVFKTQKLTNKGISTTEEAGEVNIWESKGIEYIVKVEDLLKLDGKDPKVYVTQVKSLLLLMGMIQEQQFNQDIKEPKCEFTLSYYAERRGYTKEEIEKSGNFWNELRRDLFSGAYTTYRIKQMMIDGKEYTIHNTFYGLYEPKKHENTWKVEFNNPYGRWIIEILNGEAGQYFIKDLKAIEDRTTTEKPYLFLFYQQLIKRKRANLLTPPVKIGNLLADMKIGDQILARPKECYNLLKECLIYFSKHYNPPEIEQFFLYNDFHKTQTVKMPLYVSEAFTRYGYNDFKELLKAIGIKDIREAYISFKRPAEQKHKATKLNNEEEHLLKRTLIWFDSQVTKIPVEDQVSLIKMYIKKLGYVTYKKLLEKEANKTCPNAVEFLTKILPNPNYIPGDKDWKEELDEAEEGNDYFRA